MMEVEMEMRCWKSPQINEIIPAFIRAQLALEPVGKTAVNPFYGSKYADLPDCWKGVRCFLLEGIAITQLPMPSPSGSITLDTVFAHMSGQWFKSRMTMTVAKNDPQGYGSAYSYARRYALGCMSGLVTDEDIDGNTHVPTKTRREDGAVPVGSEDTGATQQDSDAPAPRFPFDPYKGKPLVEVPIHDLVKASEWISKNIDDPKKAQFRARNEEMVFAIDAEVARRDQDSEA